MDVMVEPIRRMVHELSRLPGIGPKTAQRLAYFILSMPEEQVRELAAALYQGKKQTRFCTQCGNYATGEKCRICDDERRHNGQLCVVRDPRDVAAMERMHEYEGMYHVLHGVISPIDGIGPDDIRIRELMTRLADGEITEVILATNPDVEGEATASYISRLIKPMNVKVTRIAHGVPVGGELEYTDEVTLARAFESRMEM